MTFDQGIMAETLVLADNLLDRCAALGCQFGVFNTVPTRLQSKCSWINTPFEVKSCRNIHQSFRRELQQVERGAVARVCYAVSETNFHIETMNLCFVHIQGYYLVTFFQLQYK